MPTIIWLTIQRACKTSAGSPLGTRHFFVTLLIRELLRLGGRDDHVVLRELREVGVERRQVPTLNPGLDQVPRGVRVHEASGGVLGQDLLRLLVLGLALGRV